GGDRRVQKLLDLLDLDFVLRPAVQDDPQVTGWYAALNQFLPSLPRENQGWQLGRSDYECPAGALHDLHGSLIYYLRKVYHDAVVARFGELHQTVVVHPGDNRRVLGARTQQQVQPVGTRHDPAPERSVESRGVIERVQDAVTGGAPQQNRDQARAQVGFYYQDLLAEVIRQASRHVDHNRCCSASPFGRQESKEVVVGRWPRAAQRLLQGLVEPLLRDGRRDDLGNTRLAAPRQLVRIAISAKTDDRRLP